MRLILLTQYFPPEIGAPQNRLHAIARSLHARGVQVTVLTAMPNYPDMRIHADHRGRLTSREEMDGLDVRRVWLFVSKGRGIFARLLNYFSFLIASLLYGLFRLKRSDVLLVESPPLFLGITAMLLAKAKGAKLVFNVSDLWPESAVQLGLVKNRAMIRASTWLEERCYRSAVLVTGQTKGIVADIRERFPMKRVEWMPNGVDLDLIDSVRSVGDVRTRYGLGPKDFLIAYTGIIGHAQGLEVVLRAADVLRERRTVRFLLVGDGPERQRMIDLAAELGLTNVRSIDPMPRMEVLALVAECNAVVVPLRRNDLFKGAIPSKIFEALALGKPLLLGVEGEAHELFIEQGGGGLAFTPEDEVSLANAVVRLIEDPALTDRLGEQGRRYVREEFDRQRINDRLWQELLSITGQGNKHERS